MNEKTTGKSTYRFLLVPGWTLIALTTIFFIREVYIRSKQKPNDFDSGYRQALKDIALQWNRLAKKSLESKIFNVELRVYLQQKINDWDVKEL